jgi:DNA invertase Pin-like site-specific DNA recombinase
VIKMKRAVLYTRVSTCDQNPETQALDLRRLAEQRGFEIVHEYTDRISGAKAKRPALDQMLAAAHRREFDTVLVWAADRLARSVRHFLEVLDTLNHLGIEFVSFRENLDTGGPSGRAVVVIVSAVAELERNLIVERVRAGLRRARQEGRVLGRKPIDFDRVGLLRDRDRGMSLAQLAKVYKVSRTSVARALKQSAAAVPKTPFPCASAAIENTPLTPALILN